MIRLYVKIPDEFVCVILQDSCFDMVGPYGIILCCYYKRFTFSLKFSFSFLHPRFLV